MMLNFIPSRWTSFWAAWGIGIMLLVIGGAGYRLAEARYERQSDSIPIPAGTLAQLSLDLEEWEGREVPLDDRIVQATASDDHISRTYRHRDTGDSVTLFVAYGVKLRDLAPHRPEVCYRGAGWLLGGGRTRELVLSEGSTIPLRILEFHRGGLEAERITVLDYYIVNDEYSPDVSQLRWRAAGIGSKASYAAQVQITALNYARAERAERLVEALAVETGPEIRRILIEAVRQAAANAPRG
jgi:EpsI family protein